MAVTKVTDVIVPEIFSSYVIRKSTELSRLVQSGIYSSSADLDNLITGGGRTITMPKWNDLSGDDEIISEANPLTPGKINAAAEVAVALYRGKAWGATELSGCLAGDDPMGAIGTMVAEYWNRKEQKALIATLEGCFAADNMAELVSGNGTTAISAEAILDAKQLLGDAADKLTALAIHSAVFTQLQKLNLIKYIPNSRGEVNIPTYLGYNLIVDDGLPCQLAKKGVYTITIGGTYATSDTVTADGVTYTVLATDTTPALVATGLKAALAANSTFAGKFDITIDGAVITVTQKVAGTGDQPTVSKSSTNGTVAAATVTAGRAISEYTSYLFAAGSVARGIGNPVSLTQTETDRDSLASTDYLINRRAYVLHPIGMKWLGASVVGETPTNAELATAANWTRVADVKHMGMVKLVHTLTNPA